MPTQSVHLTDTHLSTLSNICAVAAERFSENARLFRDLEKQPAQDGALCPTGAAAARIAEQFERQAQEAHDMRDLFAGALPVTIETEEEEAA